MHQCLLTDVFYKITPDEAPFEVFVSMKKSDKSGGGTPMFEGWDASAVLLSAVLMEAEGGDLCSS